MHPKNGHYLAQSIHNRKAVKVLKDFRKLINQNQRTNLVLMLN